MSDQKEKRPKDKEEGLAAHIVGNQLQREAEKIEKELKKNKELEEVTAPDYMYDKIKDKIEEYEKDKRAEEYLRQIMEEDDEEEKKVDTALVYALLSVEDRQALRLGKELQARKSDSKRASTRWSGLKKAALFFVVMGSLFGISMTSEGNREYVMEKVNSFIGNTFMTNIDTSEDSIKVNYEQGEKIANDELVDKLGVKPVLFTYKPQGLKFEKCEVSRMGYGYVFYKYKGKVINLYIDKVKTGTVISNSVDAHKISNVKVDNIDLEVQVYEISTDEEDNKSYQADIIYLNTYYSITGQMEVEEFKKLIRGIAFV